MWERDDVGHCPERVENIGCGNLMKCEQQPESIFLEEEAQDHEASILGKWNWEGKAETRKFQRDGEESIEDKIHRSNCGSPGAI